ERGARGESLAPQPERRVERADGGPGQLREPGRARRVVEVAVGEHDLRHAPVARAGHLEHPAQVVLIVRPGVDHEHGRRARLGDHPGVRAIQRHRRRIRGEHAPGPLGAHAADRLVVRGRPDLVQPGYPTPSGMTSQAAPSSRTRRGWTGSITRRSARMSARPAPAATAVAKSLSVVTVGGSSEISPAFAAWRASAGRSQATWSDSASWPTASWPAGKAAAKNRASNRRGSPSGVI